MARTPTAREAAPEVPTQAPVEAQQDDLLEAEAEAVKAGASRVERIGNALRVDN